MKKSAVRSILLMVVTLACTVPGEAKTLVLEGGLESSLTLTQQIRFAVERPLSSHTFRFALPASYANKAVTQEARELEIRYAPQPEREEDEVDRFGNRFHKAIWKDLTRDAQITIRYRTKIAVALAAMESKTPFPLPDLPDAEKLFLQPSREVQSGDAAIISLSRELTSRSATEYEAVTAIMTHVADTIRYAYNPPQYDAIYTLKSGGGNCQNLAHYSLALLRASGIPARIVGGISLSEPWQVMMENGQSWVQRMGQGGHAWIEVYFPDLGWLSYDPLYSRQFTPTRHVKQTHGLEANDVNDSWVSLPSHPRYSETVTATFQDDRVSVRVASSLPVPRPYLLSNRFVAKSAGTALPPSPVTPAAPVTVPEAPAATMPKPELFPPLPPVAATPKLEPPTRLPPVGKTGPEPPGRKPPPVQPVPGGTIEFGNMEFPTLVDAYHQIGNEGRKILDKETSEYVTSRQIYAQAFTTPAPLKLEKISLAMRKFGGDGTIYVDVVADDHGRPGMEGVRSTPVFMDAITRKPGYYWVNFAFPPDLPSRLEQGKYWIVLRHSGETIMNWFFTPGKPYGGSDDTRSTAKGYRWEDILNYDFVFKVTGKTLAEKGI